MPSSYESKPQTEPIPEITYWKYEREVRLQERERKALRTLLKCSGADTVKTNKNGTVTARFSSWKKLEKANFEFLAPLEILFRSDTTTSVFTNPFTRR